MDGFDVEAFLFLDVGGKIVERHEHLRSAHVAQALEFFQRARRIFLRRLVLRNEFAVVGKKGVGEFMKNGEPLAFRQTALAVFDLKLFRPREEDSALAIYIVVNFLALDSEDADEFPGAVGRAGPAKLFRIGDFFAS